MFFPNTSSRFPLPPGQGRAGGATQCCACALYRFGNIAIRRSKAACARCVDAEALQSAVVTCRCRCGSVLSRSERSPAGGAATKCRVCALCRFECVSWFCFWLRTLSPFFSVHLLIVGIQRNEWLTWTFSDTCRQLFRQNMFQSTCTLLGTKPI